MKVSKKNQKSKAKKRRKYETQREEKHTGE
jgi:hypothetical protein